MICCMRDVDMPTWAEINKNVIQKRHVRANVTGEIEIRLAPTIFDMGRRKSKRKPPPKKKMTGPLDSLFTCPFCNHEKSCEVKM